MSGFIVVAGLLAFLALGALFYPLLRRRADSSEAWRSAGVAGILILVGSAALYPVWSNFKWHEPEPAADSPQAMVGRLARRLEREPGEVKDWLLLGKSYSVINQHDLAARAYQRADTLAKGQNLEALFGLGEALLESGRSDLAGRAGRVFEQAMKLDGASVKAIFYSAFAARDRNELPLARERFEMLLRASPPPPPNVVEIIQNELQALTMQQLMAASPGARAEAGAGAATQAATSPETAAPASAVKVPVRITLAPALTGKAGPRARLFVIARSPGQGGAPLAVKPLEVKFPQDVDLLSTDAMMGGSGFSAGQQLEIEARIALSGDAISRSGDPFGTVRVRAGEDRRVAIEINQLKP